MIRRSSLSVSRMSLDCWFFTAVGRCMTGLPAASPTLLLCGRRDDARQVLPPTQSEIAW